MPRKHSRCDLLHVLYRDSKEGGIISLLLPLVYTGEPPALHICLPPGLPGKAAFTRIEL